jgi:hypothetical protein
MAGVQAHKAARLGLAASTLRSQVTRLRARFREFLRAEVRRTVETEADVDGERNRSESAIQDRGRLVRPIEIDQARDERLDDLGDRQALLRRARELRH